MAALGGAPGLHIRKAAITHHPALAPSPDVYKMSIRLVAISTSRQLPDEQSAAPHHN